MKSKDQRVRAMWISPNFNHYKKRFLSRLVEGGQIELELLTGKVAHKQGHKGDEDHVPYKITEVNVTKKNAAIHPAIYAQSMKCLQRDKFDIILMPFEKKFLPLMLWFVVLRLFFGFKLIGYNHPVFRSRRDRVTKGDIIWTRWVYKLYDRVIIYTEQGYDWCIEKKILPKEKAFYANNTLDTESIWQDYQFEINTNTPIRLLFIGRLISIKKLDLLFEYFSKLELEVPNIELSIIGDGPEAEKVRAAMSGNPKIKWCGTLIEEALIAKEMRNAHAIFIPGHSGLSIVHAFAYGKPYFTLKRSDQTHAPEIDYLRDGENGLFLEGEIDENVTIIKQTLQDKQLYKNMCEAAFSTAKSLTIDKWCKHMVEALVLVDINSK